MIRKSDWAKDRGKIGDGDWGGGGASGIKHGIQFRLATGQLLYENRMTIAVIETPRE